MNLFAWTFECMQYILNSTASDVFFSDTTVYENMNRLVKLLSYRPKAYRSSQCEFSVAGEFASSYSATLTIPRFTHLETGKNDSSGNPIIYAFTKDYTFTVRNGSVLTPAKKPILTNGQFYVYEFENASTGAKYESFDTSGINEKVDDSSMSIFMKWVDDDGEDNWEEVSIVDSLVLDASSTDLACEQTLLEDKEISIKFGDGVHGKIPPDGAMIYLVYLKSNGAGGKITAGDIKSSTLRCRIDGMTNTDDFLNMCYGGKDNFDSQYSLFKSSGTTVFSTSKLVLSNTEDSSDVEDYEDIDEIRANAPDSFRRGERLITASDFKSFVLENFSSRIKDAYVCNNVDYCLNFFKWLDENGKLSPSIGLSGYSYSDANNFNNVYIWLLPNSRKLLDQDLEVVVQKCDSRKFLGCNVIPCRRNKDLFLPMLGYN